MNIQKIFNNATKALEDITLTVKNQVNVWKSAVDGQIQRLEDWKNNYSNAGLGLKKYKTLIGYRSWFQKAVIPLVKLDNTNIENFSYTAGRFELIRTNGCCVLSGVMIDIKAIKNYDSENFTLTKINVTDAYVKPCKFRLNGVLYGGIHIYHCIQAHGVVFTGVSNIDLTYKGYIDTRDNTVINQEIKDSLELLA